jgi:hypothetical protein
MMSTTRNHKYAPVRRRYGMPVAVLKDGAGHSRGDHSSVAGINVYDLFLKEKLGAPVAVVQIG